jgi:hypothetical protein
MPRRRSGLRALDTVHREIDEPVKCNGFLLFALREQTACNEKSAPSMNSDAEHPILS